jgi:hypothetical protein
MGGSGGGGGRGYFPSTPAELHKIVEQSQNDLKRQAVEREIGEYLQSLLSTINERDAKATREALDKIAKVIQEAVEIDQLLFGGSVAKHTFVDGLSDVDALVVLDADANSGKTANQVLGRMFREIKDGLSSAIYKDVSKGQMAVTVTLRDGTEIQLVPALKSGNTVSVPDRRTGGWIPTDPKSFQKQLTSHNAKLGGVLVPAIKLVKSVIGALPEPKQISGYHVEALAIDAAKAYSGSANVKAMVTHIFKHAAERVLSPMSDVTGQSTAIDSNLGAANSNPRRIVADALAAVGRKLEAASSMDQWKNVFD